MSARLSTETLVPRRALRSRVAVCAAALALPVLPDVAAADDPTFRATAPSELAYPGAQPVFRLEMTTGSEEERFEVSIAADSLFPGTGGTLTKIGDVTLEGPGRSTVYGPAIKGPPPPCQPPTALRNWRGAGSWSMRVALELPANSTSALVVPTPVAGDPPWPGMEAGVRYAISNPLDGTSSPFAGTLAAPQRIMSPRARVVGRSGVQIGLATDPPGRSGGCGLAPIAPGTEVVVGGTTNPPVAGQLLDLVYVPPGGYQPQPLATVRADSAGAFAHRGWRPALAGPYHIGAFYRSQSPELVDDFAMPTTVLVGAAPPPPVAEAVLSLGRARTSTVTRAGLARVRLRCLSAAAPCRGVLRLTRGIAGGWSTLGRTGFDVAGGRTRVVSVRIGRRGRALLRRRRTLHVRAEALAADGRTMARLGLRLKAPPRRRSGVEPSPRLRPRSPGRARGVGRR